MGHHRIVIDSDDDVDDFPSLRPASPISTSTSTGVAMLPRPRVQALARTPKALKVDTADATPAPNTTLRRRKLGKINNDASLLRPWGDSRYNTRKKRTPDSSELPEIDLPNEFSPEPVRRKSRVELSTRRTRRISELPADYAGELSTEEASVLEDITLEDDHTSEDVSNTKDSSDLSIKHDDDHINDQPEHEAQNEDEDQNDGNQSEDEGDQHEDSYSDTDSEASEFQDSSICSDSSFGSLGDYFSRSPSRRPTAAKSSNTQAQKGKETPIPPSDEAPCAYADEGSSIFFSAEESFTAHGVNIKPKPEKQAQAQPRTSSSRAKTPPLDVPDKGRASRLNSPTKKLPRIPQTPHRPSTDAFWNQMVVDDWNMEHSPRKLLFDPAGTEKGKQSKSTVDKTLQGTGAVPATKKGTTAAAKEKEAKKLFQKAKHKMAEKFLAELDDAITDGQLSRLAAATGGVKIEWTNKLNTTAGRANWRRETLRPKKAPVAINVEDGSVTDTSATSAATRVHHHASIELAEKVIDDEHRLLNVIAHEFCHLANFMVSGITGNPHGKEFKAWAAKCSQHFGHRGIQVTTKHAYEIDFKYVWTCEACATEFKRHSKSIDPTRHRCGACKGVLKQTKPVPRGNGANKASKTSAGRGSTATPGPSEYQKFMKEHMAIVRRENPNSPQKMIMTLVADKWSKAKEQKKAASSLTAVVAQDNTENGDAGVCIDNLGKALVDLTLN
ncbi:hypothetical protein SEUCBS139899_000433 [Sporothrix eucalyptigena]|uniref:SprT-like domain-containing protein n=1 Tax=Sporothrix eucalyptigena TaxID=1812306 RepID=A0ABP0BC14_9PEZI